MRLGIRAKLVGTLLFAGLFPLALALTIILVGVIELRIGSKGRMYRAFARQQARHLSAMIGSQIELANAIHSLPETEPFLRQANAVAPSNQKQISGIELNWPALKENQSPLREILENPMARQWQSVARNQRRFDEIIMTDLSGRLVAATNKTTDFYQADEKWWKDAYDNGKGRLLISGVVFDASAISTAGKPGTVVADLCIPIYDSQRALIGITKISLDATWMLRQMELGLTADDTPRMTWLVRGNGDSIRSPGFEIPVERISARAAARVRTETDGWMVDHDTVGVELLAFASVEQSRLLEQADEQWHVMVGSGRSDVLASIYRMGWGILAMGVVIIAGCFLGGLWMAQREVIRPLKKLEYAVAQIQGGNRAYRLSEARGRKEDFREDEVGRLAHDFNIMAGELESNLDRLEAADALKRQFIDLASHELRTPVTYILGASQLAERKNGNGSAAIMAKISSKAQRLNRIVENMFKLLASDRFDKTLRSSEVDIASLIRSVVQDHDPFIAERRQEWRIQIEPDLPRIQADAEKIRDIIANLVSNAIRFTPDGDGAGVTASSSTDSVEIAVRDSGPGIAQEDLPHLFTPFFTGGAVERHSSGDFSHMSRGVGLGLSVVKRFVDLHGGRIMVDTSTSGTTVRVSLPIKFQPTTGPVPISKTFDS